MLSLRISTMFALIVFSAGAAAQSGGSATFSNIFSGISAFGDSCKNKCVVTITVSEPCATSANVVVDPLELEMKGRKGTIVFRLPKAGDYAFCPANGDGVFLQPYQSANQFANPAATDNDSGDEDSDVKEKCRKNFRVYNYNGDSKETRYYYFLKFTNTSIADPTKNSCSKDPWIRNG